jgi:hypothetical protein
MKGLCLIGAFLFFIFIWIYVKVSDRDKGIKYTSWSSSAVYKSDDRASSKGGYCRICGAEVIVDELPDSISRDAFEQFGLCLNCQWGIIIENGGHF